MTSANRFAIAAVAVIALAGLPRAAQQHRRARATTPKKPAAAQSAAATAESRAQAEIARENNLGVALMNRQQFDAALGHFQRVCVLDLESDAGCLNMGIALLNAQHYDQARNALSKSTERDPGNPRGWYNLGLLEKSQGKPEAAIEDFKKVAAIDPGDADTQYFLGLLYSQQQKYPQAIAAYQNALKLSPFHASAEYSLAQAEQRSGNSAAAQVHLDKFQHITAAKLGTPISFVYGEEGKYSLAEGLPPSPGQVPAAIAVRFVETTRSAGLAGSPAIPARPRNTSRRARPRLGAAAAAGAPSTSKTQPNSARSLADFLGSGACVLDYNGDGKPDIFVGDADGKGDAALYRNLGAGKFSDATRQAKLSVKGALGCAVGDYDNDGHPDLAISSPGGIALYHNEANGTFADATEKTGIRADSAASAGPVPHDAPEGSTPATFPGPAYDTPAPGAPLALGLTFIDYDHDGDLDLYVTRFRQFPLGDAARPFAFPAEASGPGNILWRNNGNGTFTEWTKAAGLGGNGPSVGAIGSDVNNDRAIDFVVTGWQKDPTVLLNPREGAFREIHPWASAMPGPTAGGVALDFNKDGWMDLAFTHWAAPGLSLWRNDAGKSFARVEIPDPAWRRGWGVAALDYDNDGWMDLAAVGETESGEGRVLLLRNEGSHGFRDVTHETGLDKVVLRNPRGIVALDYDADGATDLLITQNGLRPVLLRNVGGSKNHSVPLTFSGAHDNKSGIGTKVNVFHGAQQQKWEVAGASGYLGQSSGEILAGLGADTKADVVRLLWPTGVLQDELDVPAGKREQIGEIDRRGSSCPIVFVWDGKKFEFLADMIGPGIVGHWIAPKERDTPDPDEYFKVAGSQVQALNGRIRFRMIEPMEELDYLDQARLLAVDHPAGVEVWPNERFASNPPFPKFKVIASEGAHPPEGAWDGRGRSVLPLLVEKDRNYVADFPGEPYQGFADMHSLTLDIGAWDPARPLRLILDGFTDYFSANSMYAAWQAGIQPVPPFVEAQNAAGKWVRVVDDMGFPAGLARTMIADLTGKLPAGTRRIRITTNLKVYWDRIRVDNSPANLPFRVSEIPLASADLHFRGYPRVVEHNPKNDLTYIYEDVSATGPYTRQTGNYTRYGDVKALVGSSDNEYVIFGSGDEVAVDFDAAHMPALPPGWTRDYFFYADGFAKDMDFYAAHGDTVSPLPFHTTVPYPYPAGIGYPVDEQHLNYLLDYNTRGVAGPAGSSYLFNYKDGGH
ncbi:MAG TPA: FG-GAP-like repeat-containing protein [Candidatus Acidoferrales bacterium]|nr:FG-GAP-like repeat-containing protein [Candidatus Acidoferrales bacterium]